MRQFARRCLRGLAQESKTQARKTEQRAAAAASLCPNQSCMEAFMMLRVGSRDLADRKGRERLLTVGCLLVAVWVTTVTVVE